jgi:uncharacterized Fe-S cluster-containing radical SAM superfamily protein
MKTDEFNYQVKKFLRVLRKAGIELSARAAGRRFYCNALTGDSDYSISVNSDMSVSCNCQDYDGTGRIGDLSRQDLAEIFSGAVAASFRVKLSEGKLPIPACAACRELRQTERERAARYVGNYHIPRRGIMVENTISCNLNCTACFRSRVMSEREKSSLSLDDVRKISSLLREEKIGKLSYFNLGEPFLSPRIHEELKIIREENPSLDVHVSTNGMCVEGEGRSQAALLLDHITFSIDGASTKIARKYQRNADFDRSYRNMKNLVQLRDAGGTGKPLVEWKYVLFRWNDNKREVRRAIELAREAGVDLISFWPTNSPLYGISLRYRFGGYVRRVGEKGLNRREVFLKGRKPGSGG